MRPFARFTKSTCPSSIMRRMCRSCCGAVRMRFSSGSARNAPTLFCMGAMPSAR